MKPPAKLAPIATELAATCQNLAADLAVWAQRDDSGPQPEAAQAAHAAVDTIDAVLAELHAIRGQLITEIRENQDTAMTRSAALLASRQDGDR